MKILLLTPPITQLNTPYPATAYLTGFLRSRGYDCIQRDPSIDLIHEVFNRDSLRIIKDIIFENYDGIAEEDRPEVINFFLKHFYKYESTVEGVISFLRGSDSSLSLRIGSRNFLPEGPAFDALKSMKIPNLLNNEDPLSWAFGNLGSHDKAKYLSSLYLDDLAAVLRNGVDPFFELSRYAERLAASNPCFDDLYDAIKNNFSYIDEVLEELTEQYINETNPTVVGLTVPFPGNVYGAFKIAQKIREIAPKVKIVLGGGFVNTELRELKDIRVFEFVDYITIDDGEMPFISVLEHVAGIRHLNDIYRTLVMENSQVKLKTNRTDHDVPHKNIGTPTYDGLDLSKYLSIFEMLNPMHRIWSDGRWNKLTMAHGCYWAKCSFCDISLDYIERYNEASADVLIDRIEKMIKETGQTGFHFVDEAAPPKIMFALAKRLVERNIQITWWGNIRFEKAFTEKRCRLLAKSGLVAVSGGLEVASDRLLKLMDKGVTVAQVAKVTKAFRNAGVKVHAYLMYGFPTQTELETVESLDRVRQLFANGCIDSAYWHRFAATVYSPVGLNPEKFGIKLYKTEKVMFASNDVEFEDPLNVDHEMLGRGLKKALYNYMHGVGIDYNVNDWFECKLPKSKISKNLISSYLT